MVVDVAVLGHVEAAHEGDEHLIVELGAYDVRSRRLLRMISAASRHLVVELEVVGGEHVLDGLVRDDAGVGRVGGGEGGVERLRGRGGRSGIINSFVRRSL